jgi:outer membrane lipoprotein SlyB
VVHATETAEFGAAVGSVIGGVTGALIGLGRDDFGTLVYKK